MDELCKYVPHECNHGGKISDHGVVSGKYLSPGGTLVGEPVSILLSHFPQTALVKDIRVVST